MLISELLVRYLSMHPMRATSALSLSGGIKKLKVVIGDKDIETISIADAVKWRSVLSDTVRATTYNSHTLKVLALFRFGFACGLVTRDCPLLMLRKAQIPIRPAPTVDSTFFERAQDFFETTVLEDPSDMSMQPRWFWYCMLVVLTYSGIRRRQLAMLEWGDVDLKNGVIRLSAAASKSRRESLIPMPSVCVPFFEDLLARTQHITGNNIKPADQVFHFAHFSTRAKQQNMGDQAVTNGICKLGKELGITVSPHRLRHTAATRWMEATGQLKSIKVLLGHNDDSPTFSYVHPDIHAMRAAVVQLD